MATPAQPSIAQAALTGLIMDMFSSTPGMHMSACTLMMFARIHLTRLLAPREGYEYGMVPSVASMGMAWFLTYAGTLVLIHHLWLFFVEIGRAGPFFSTFFRALLSGIFTLGLCLLAQFLTTRPDRRRT